MKAEQGFTYIDGGVCAAKGFVANGFFYSEIPYSQRYIYGHDKKGNLAIFTTTTLEYPTTSV